MSLEGFLPSSEFSFGSSHYSLLSKEIVEERFNLSYLFFMQIKKLQDFKL